MNPIEIAFSKLKALLPRSWHEPSTPSSRSSAPPLTVSFQPNEPTSSMPQDSNAQYEIALAHQRNSQLPSVAVFFAREYARPRRSPPKRPLPGSWRRPDIGERVHRLRTSISRRCALGSHCIGTPACRSLCDSMSGNMNTLATDPWRTSCPASTPFRVGRATSAPRGIQAAVDCASKHVSCHYTWSILYHPYID